MARGVYSLPGRALSEHRSLAEVALRAPRGVVCLLSALRVHGIGTQAPFEVWLVIPPHTPTPRLDQPALRVVRMSGAALTEGVEPIGIDGVQVPVFNANKTVADCFKYRNKIGLDVALEALRDGWAQRKLDHGCALVLRRGQPCDQCNATLPGKCCGVTFHHHARPAYLHTLELDGQAHEGPTVWPGGMVVSQNTDRRKLRFHEPCSP